MSHDFMCSVSTHVKDTMPTFLSECTIYDTIRLHRATAKTSQQVSNRDVPFRTLCQYLSYIICHPHGSPGTPPLLSVCGKDQKV